MLIITQLFESLTNLFSDVIICCNSFDKSSPILYAAEFCVLITSLIFNELLWIFNNGLAEGVFRVWGFKSLFNFSLINPFSLGSFNFLLTLDLTLFILSFLNYDIYSGYSIPFLSFRQLFLLQLYTSLYLYQLHTSLYL